LLEETFDKTRCSTLRSSSIDAYERELHAACHVIVRLAMTIDMLLRMRSLFDINAMLCLHSFDCSIRTNVIVVVIRRNRPE
jgi:hypothetical protein